MGGMGWDGYVNTSLLVQNDVHLRNDWIDGADDKMCVM